MGGAAFRSSDCTIHQSLQRRGIGHTFLEQFQISEHSHEQIVEVVGYTSGKLAKALHFLHLVHLRQRGLAFARTLLDALLKLCVGDREVGGSRLNAALEFRVQQFEFAGLADAKGTLMVPQQKAA